MNDKDFDKLFGDQLGQELPFDFDEKNWQKLSLQLDNAATNQHPKFAWRNWLWLFLPLLLLLNLWQMGRSNAIADQNQQLLHDMAELKNSLNATSFLKTRDTIVILQTDTVFVVKTVVKKEYFYPPTSSFLMEKKASNSASDNTQNLPALIQNNVEKTNSNKSNEQYVQELLDKIKGLENKLKILQQSIDSQQLITNKNATETVKNSTLIGQKNEVIKGSLPLVASADSAKKSLPPSLTKHDSTQKHPLSIIEPKPLGKPTTARLFIGLNGGIIHYKSLWTNTQGVEIGRTIRSHQVGLKAEYALTDRLRVTAGGDFCPFEFQNYWRDSRYNLPDPNFNSWTERFFSVKAKQELMQGFFGLKYMLTHGQKRWRPYVGAAYTATIIRPFTTEYEYRTINGNTSRFETMHSEGKNMGKLLMASGGAEYRLNRHFVSQIDAFYYFDLNRPHKTYDLFGLRGALLFNF